MFLWSHCQPSSFMGALLPPDPGKDASVGRLGVLPAAGGPRQPPEKAKVSVDGA